MDISARDKCDLSVSDADYGIIYYIHGFGHGQKRAAFDYDIEFVIVFSIVHG
jgi:hypothetical protein